MLEPFRDPERQASEENPGFVFRLQKYGHVVGDAQRRAADTLAKKIERHTEVELMLSVELIPNAV